MAARSDLLIARVSAIVFIDGVRHQIHRGRTTAHVNHPIVRGREHMWRPLTVDFPAEPTVREEESEVPKARKRAPSKSKGEPEQQVAEAGSETHEDAE